MTTLFNYANLESEYNEAIFFLVACTRFYKQLCRNVGQLVADYEVRAFFLAIGIVLVALGTMQLVGGGQAVSARRPGMNIILLGLSSSLNSAGGRRPFVFCLDSV